jgi:biopolymer transport protein ExbD
MKINRRRKSGAEVSTHSLNDIMFFLLLFFLIISTMANPNVIKVLLPEAADNQEKEAKKNVQLTVDANKAYYLDGETITLEQLEVRLEAIHKTDPEATCAINIDRTLTVQDLVDVMQIGSRHDIKMYLKTGKPS